MPLYWIWFAELKQLNLRQKHMLLEHFRDPEEVFHAQPQSLEAAGLPQTQIQALQDKDLTAAEKIAGCCKAQDIRVLTLQDSAYPRLLKHTYDHPILLYYKGVLPDWEAQPVIGIVGTRKASPYGMNTALRFGRQIAACGAAVVSGGALGIDTMAIQGALQTGQPVVCVLGSGVDVVYPRANRELFEKVCALGCLISEYPPGTEPRAWHFPLRNRIITGISNGLLVVEAPEKSGALSSACHAMEQGRDVFAVPGNVDVDSCAGSNALLQEGAIPALSGWDVVKEYSAQFPGAVHRRELPLNAPELPLRVAQKPMNPGKTEGSKTEKDKKSIDKEDNCTYSVVNKPLPALNPSEQAVLACISREGCPVDEVIVRSELSPGAVKSVLTKLALKQLVIQHPGGRVSLK